LGAKPQVEVVPATDELAAQLVASMRQADVAEVLAHGFDAPATAVAESIRKSAHAFAMLINGEVAAVFGVGPVEPPEDGFPACCCIWALTSRTVDKHPRAFARASRPIVAALVDHCGTVWNYVDARYTTAVRWLEWLGFRVGAAVPFGPNGEPFHPFTKRTAAWAP
jgi:hypothetical protein